MPHGKRYAAPASAQLQSPVRKARLRPLRSARRPANRRLHNATTENVPMTNPTARSAPPGRGERGARDPAAPCRNPESRERLRRLGTKNAQAAVQVTPLPMIARRESAMEEL